MLSCPCRGASYFSLRGQRKVTKREATPMARPPGILPCGCAGGFRGFPTAHPCTGGKLARIPAGHPADFPPPARRAIGAPKEQRAPSAQKQRPEQSKALRAREPFASGAHDARLLFRGPWAAVRRGRQGRAAGEATDGLAFSRGQESARKARPRLTHLPGRTPGKRQPGWPFSLVTFSLATQRESNSGAYRRSKPLCSLRTSRSKSPSPPTPLPQAGEGSRPIEHGAHV